MLLPARLRVRVETPPDRDELRGPGVDELVELLLPVVRHVVTVIPAMRAGVR